ncbi:MAG: glycosyltransferase [Solirubrobacterales bacterium]|nr:glycosyltransferase [Solirubrobacterales bacterium]
MRIVVCENGLGNSEGHHFNVAAGIREELARRDVESKILTHLSIDSSLCAELAAIPVFDTTPYDSLMPRTRGHQLRACFRTARRFAHALSQVEITEHDVLLVLVTRPAEMLGLCMWSAGEDILPGAVFLNFMTDDLNAERTATPVWMVRLLYRLGFALLKRRFTETKLVLSGESGLLCSAIARLAAAPVNTAPMLHGSPPVVPSRVEGAPRTIGFLGSPRPEKGARLLGSLVEACALACQETQVVVQLPEGFSGRPGDGWPANVQELPVGLSRESFYELLGRLDAVVLPYDRSTFGTATSGLFADAVSIGAVTVVPAGTWMSSMLERGAGAGVVFEQFGVDSIVRAVSAALAEIEHLLERAASKRAAWRTEHGAAAYVDWLLEEAGGHPSDEAVPATSGNRVAA